MKKVYNILLLINIIFLSYLKITGCSWEDNRANLNTVSTLLGLPSLAANNEEQYISINHSWYKEAQNFKNKPLLSTFNVAYYQDSSGDIEVGYQYEKVGIIYVKITADPNDLYWKGATPLIAINLERSLATVSSLMGMAPITVNSQQKYHNINVNLYNQAQDFKYHPLAAGFTVHYFTDQAATIVADNNKQIGGDIWIIITAAEHDHYWTGISNSLKLTLINSSQISLDTIKNLEGIATVTIIANQANSKINKNIYNQANCFKQQPLAPGFTVQYFSDQEATMDVTSNEQVGGDIYVKITAAANDPYWTGTSLPLQLTLIDKRPDLNTISNLAGMDPIIVNPDLTYQAINKNVINTANQLKNDPLTGNFTIHYFSDKVANHLIDDYYQQIGIVYVIISPDYCTNTKWKANKIPIALPIQK